MKYGFESAVDGASSPILYVATQRSVAHVQRVAGVEVVARFSDRERNDSGSRIGTQFD
jgi:hypothetical protein